MPSPICLVNNTTTTNGVDVTSAATVTIRLFDTAGITQWSIQCLNTDDALDKDTINAGLSINQAAKTATFTAPTAPSDGAALIFESKVNNGLDRNNRVDLSLTTRFGIYILTTAGQRLFAFDETTESNAEFGWIEKINNIVRLIGSGGAVGSGSAGDGLVFSSSAYNVASANSYITVNSNNIQANAASAATPSVLVARDGSGNSSFVGVTATTGTITTLGSTTGNITTVNSTTGNITDVNSTTVTTGTVAATGATTLALSGTLLTLSSSMNVTSLGNSGTCLFKTENQTGSTTGKGLGLLTGTTVNGLGGNLTLGTGQSTGAANSGDLALFTGRSTAGTTQTTGEISITTGEASGTTGQTGDISIGTGDATGSSGDVSIYTGAGVSTSGNISLLIPTGSFGSGQKVIFIANRAANPSSNPTGGGILYAEAGALKWRGSSGTVTTLGVA